MIVMIVLTSDYMSKLSPHYRSISPIDYNETKTYRHIFYYHITTNNL